MAILKKITNQRNGADMNYHTIDHIELYDFDGKRARLAVKSYWSEEAYRGGKTEMWSETFDCENEAFKGTSKVPQYSELYSSLKCKDTFKDAEDSIDNNANTDNTNEKITTTTSPRKTKGV